MKKIICKSTFTLYSHDKELSLQILTVWWVWRIVEITETNTHTILAKISWNYRKNLLKRWFDGIFLLVIVIIITMHWCAQCGNYGILLPQFFPSNQRFTKGLNCKSIWRKKFAWQWISRFYTQCCGRMGSLLSPKFFSVKSIL